MIKLTKTISLTEGIIVSLVSMLVVFAVLILISMCINALKMLGTEKTFRPEPAIPAEPETRIPHDISPATIAVISGALTAILGPEAGGFSIQSIRKAD